MRLISLALCLVLACNGGTTDDTGTEEGTGGDGTGPGEGGENGEGGPGDEGTDTGPTNDSDIPDDPSPFTLTVSGAYNGDLVFDSPSCTWPYGSANFRVFWRNSSGDHVFVLVAELLGSFEGAGTYNETDHGARVKLQEEAGGSGSYYALDADQGDTTAITVDYAEYDDLKDAGVAWGEFTVSGMHDSSGGQIQLSPNTVPIWCPTVN